MGKKNRGSTRAEYGAVLVAGALVTPIIIFLAFNNINYKSFTDLEIFFSVSKRSKLSLSSLYSSLIKPWLCPPYVYLLVNFIIIFIAASSSFITSHKPPKTTDHHHHDGDSFEFIRSESSPTLIAAAVSHSDNIDTNAVFDHTFKLDEAADYIGDIAGGDELGEREIRSSSSKQVQQQVSTESTSSVRELRKSKTFGVSESLRGPGRRERYVRILSQQELDRQVEAFIHRCKRTPTSHPSLHTN